MSTVFLNDRDLVRKIGNELEDIIRIDGAEHGLSFLKSWLSSYYGKSRIFRQDISKLESVKKLLSQIEKVEAEAIKQSLYGTNSAN